MKTLTIFLALLTCIFSANNFLRAQCATPTAQADLDIANVRARILNGGDMWWDAVNGIGPKYEVPIGSGNHVLYSGAIWIGGLDAGNNIHLAAQTYRQNGLDYWPGPLDSMSASYNQLWKLTKQEVIDFIGGAPASNTIMTWPGNGPNNQPLAPYHDSNGDGVYNYSDGDYPDFGLTGSSDCCDILHGDQVIWWVINDACTTHTETGAPELGIEIHCQAFAFSTSDADINNTTFYQYTLINGSTNTYSSTYFGIFADVDLGSFLDDYVGCDVSRSMGYGYNGVDNNPPAIGIDFLSGPLADPADSLDNNRNCIIDEPGEIILMSKFISPAIGNYYAQLSASGLTYASTNIPCSFMFPGNSDHQYEWGTGGNCTTPAPAQLDWDEYIAGNVPGDRRFLMSAGPFTFTPGAVHCITMAAVWAQDTTDPGPYYSLAALQAADDKVQMFFDSCFNENVLGINEPENLHANIFPNPVNDVIEINFDRIVSDGKFIIYDIEGRRVKQINIKHQQKLSVSLKNLSSGIYVYKILLPDGKTTGGKFIKE